MLHGTLTKSITSVPVRRSEKSRFPTPPVWQADIRADESSDKEVGIERSKDLIREMSGEGGQAADLEAGEVAGKVRCHQRLRQEGDTKKIKRQVRSRIRGKSALGS